MFSVQGVRGAIEGLTKQVAEPRSENNDFQVRIKVRDVIGQMDRLLSPIQRQDKGGERERAQIAAEQMGIPREKVTSVKRLVSDAESAYNRGDVGSAIEHAREALLAWNA